MDEPIIEIVHILLMGLAGAGKSTFIKTFTGNPNIPTGAGLDSVTKDIDVYIKNYKESGRTYEIYLYHCPGFGDGSVTTLEILGNITKLVNHICRDYHMAGFLYLHDITQPRMSAAGEKGIRVLERMLGRDKWGNCTLVTTKWNCSKMPEEEKSREQELRTRDKYWKSMIQGNPKASIKKFLNTEESALKILKPHLNKRFKPDISLQMADPFGPLLPLGKTGAGLVAGGIRQNLEQHELDHADKILGQKFDEKKYQELVEEKERLMKAQRTQRGQRIICRTLLYAGAITVTAMTLGLGAGSFNKPWRYEVKAIEEKKKSERKMARLDKKIRKAKKGANVNDATKDQSLPEPIHEPPSLEPKIEVESADAIPTATSEPGSATGRIKAFAGTFSNTMSFGKDLFAKMPKFSKMLPKAPKAPKTPKSATSAKAQVARKYRSRPKTNKIQTDTSSTTSSDQSSATDDDEEDDEEDDDVDDDNGSDRGLN